MVDKYNITGMVNNNSGLGVIDAVNTASHNALGLAILILIMTFVTYQIQKKTNDLGKGFIQGLFITGMIGVVLYYAGQSIGATFISPLILLSIFMLDACGVAWLWFSRQAKREQR